MMEGPTWNSYMWVPCTTIMDLSSTHCLNFTKEVPGSTFNLSTKSRTTRKQWQLSQLLKIMPSSYMGFFKSYYNWRVPQHRIEHTTNNGLTNMINNEKKIVLIILFIIWSILGVQLQMEYISNTPYTAMTIILLPSQILDG